MSASLLQLNDVKTHYPVESGFLLRRQTGLVKAVDGVSLSLAAGEVLDHSSSPVAPERTNTLLVNGSASLWRTSRCTVSFTPSALKSKRDGPGGCAWASGELAIPTRKATTVSRSRTDE